MHFGNGPIQLLNKTKNNQLNNFIQQNIFSGT